MPKDSLTEHLDYGDLVHEAKLMGYPEPRCGNCRYMRLSRPTQGLGLCRAPASPPMPAFEHEVCLRWEPRWGLLLGKRAHGTAGDLGDGW